MTAFTLKLIAAATMLVDHFGIVFSMPEIYRLIGRVAFPLFIYLIVQGCRHTKNINKYLLRLGIFALISEIPFDIMRNNGNIDFLRNTNVIYTLFLGVASVAVYEQLKKKLTIGQFNKTIALLTAIPLIYLANVLSADYGVKGAGLIFLMYLTKPDNKYVQAAVLAAGMLFIYYTSFPNYYFFLFSLIAVGLIFVYNEQQGKKLKWLFYVFYPAHIILLVTAGHFIL
jgi:hypothetical protein